MRPMSERSLFPVTNQSPTPFEVAGNAVVSATIVPLMIATNPENLEPFLDQDYRDAYLDAYVKSSIALQINALRGNASQAEFAAKLGTTQSIVSRLEDENYGSETINTLLKIAKRNDVALDVRFVDYPTMLSRNVGTELTTVSDVFQSYEQCSQLGFVSAPQTISMSIYNPIVVVIINAAPGAEKWQIDPPAERPLQLPLR
jgi:transcriptional regulator with XRE-family HTH domain